MVKVLCRVIKALDLCIAEISPGGRLLDLFSLWFQLGPAKEKRPRRNAVSSRRYSSANLADTLSLKHKMQHSGRQI